MKTICTQSGYTLGVPSAHPPPLPHPAPARSLLLIAVTGCAALNVVDALATAPVAASATLEGPALTPHASTSVMRDDEFSAPVMLIRMRLVVYCAKLTVRLTRLLPLTLPSVSHELPFQAWTLKSVTP